MSKGYFSESLINAVGKYFNNNTNSIYFNILQYYIILLL